MARPSLPVLTGLRFFAAMLVVMFHFAPPNLVALWPTPIAGWLVSGYEAVTFFFILSGFILFYVYAGDATQSPLTVQRSTFLLSRFARIAPAYYLALVIALPSFAYSILVAKIVPADVAGAATILVPTFMQSWYAPASFSWNGPAWSLSVEAFFYIIFPVIYNSMVQSQRGHRFWLCVACGLAVLVEGARWCTSPLATNYPHATVQYFIQYFPLFHVPAFIFGMALGRYFLFCNEKSDAMFSLTFYCGAIAALMLLGFRTYLPNWLLLNPILLPIFGALIFGAAGLRQSQHRVLHSPTLALLGEASFAIYILHGPIKFWLDQARKNVPSANIDATANLGVDVLVVVAVSVVVYRFFEIPLRKTIIQRARHRTWRLT